MLVAGLIEKIGGSESRIRQRRRKADGTFDEQIYSGRLEDHRHGFDFRIFLGCDPGLRA